MFLRRISRKKDGKCHYYWALVESYRTERGSRQRVVCYLGDKGKRKGKGVKSTLERCTSYQQDFLSPEELPEKVEVNAQKTRTERRRDFGGVWLGLQLFRKLGLEDFFSQAFPEGRELVSWASVIKVLTICRFYSPSSELEIAEHLYEQSAMDDLLGIPVRQIYENRLYRGLDRLLPYKDELHEHLRNRLGTLFSLQYDLFLYDVTSTYFEGEMNGSELAQRGYSRDSRPDCKQVCIGLVVTREGIPLGYEVFEGNRHDSKTVREIVEKLEGLYGRADRIWVMDRGMVSQDNIAFLRQSERRYIIGTPKNSLRKFEQHFIEKDWEVVREGVSVKTCESPDTSDEIFILCKSEDRAEKEKAMHDRFVKRIEAGIEILKRACIRQKGKDVRITIERRLGRLLAKNSRAAALFDIKTKYDSRKNQTVLIVNKKDSQENWVRISEGYYLLRTNITNWDPQQLWTAYIHLTEAESAFRIHKSDLCIRPVWHQKDNRIKAHIFVCFLSFVMWKTFGLMCKNAGLGDEPRRIYKEIKKITMVDVVLITTKGEELKIRTVARTEKPLQFLLHKVGLALPERLTKRIL